jgi:hypothetical protein
MMKLEYAMEIGNAKVVNRVKYLYAKRKLIRANNMMEIFVLQGIF